ncbi:MAG: VOC family protein [Alicyclobacillus sp.]|nr:VOC family protein [Alicyclobacillus sp.]
MADNQPNLRITALYEYYLPVTHAEDSASWYVDNFGMIREPSLPHQATVRLQQGARLTLIESDTLNCYESNPFHIKAHDARKAHAALDKARVKTMEPEDWHHYVDFVVFDPDGNRFDVISDPSWPNTPNNYFRLDGIFLGAADFSNTLTWYQDLLGVDIEYDFFVQTPSNPEARMCCFRGMPVTVFESPLSRIHGRVCEFQSEDARADYNFMRRHGVRVSEFTETLDKRSFSFFDPEGREFGILEFRK